MAFINALHNVIRKSNRDLLYFYTSDNSLFFREFKFPKNWNSSVKLIDTIDEHLINIQIDDSDNIYGIAATQAGNVLYLYSDKSGFIHNKELFSFNSEKYELLFPYIAKFNNTLHIMYFFQDLQSPNYWTLLSHYYDGNMWGEYCVDTNYSYPFPSPFTVIFTSDFPTIIYLKDNEIYTSSFIKSENNWTSPIQITNTYNKKVHFSVLKDNKSLLHILWSEFINDSLVIRYANGILDNNSFTASKIHNLSEPSNCSFPSISKINNVLWAMWIKLDHLYRCYSTDNGHTWSQPTIDSRSKDQDYIRYNFNSNYTQDLNHFNVSTIFGTFKPKISFIGFDGSIES